MQHVFTAPPTSQDRRARMEWVRENRATVRGVKVTPATAWTKCFRAQRSLTVREANPHMYVQHMYDRYRYEVVFAAGLKALGVHKSGVHPCGDGTVDVYAPDGMGQPCVVLSGEPLENWQDLLS